MLLAKLDVTPSIFMLELLNFDAYSGICFPFQYEFIYALFK